MELREWKKEYTQNLEKLDDYHRKFMEIINMLIKIKEERSCEEEISLVFFRLIYYVENYFIEEENYLREYSYPEFKSHKEIHNDFIRGVIRFQEEYQNGDKTVCERLYTFLQEWFEGHILSDDQKAAEFILEQKEK